jgi:hypothetical protein
MALGVTNGLMRVLGIFLWSPGKTFHSAATSDPVETGSKDSGTLLFSLAGPVDESVVMEGAELTFTEMEMQPGEKMPSFPIAKVAMVVIYSLLLLVFVFAKLWVTVINSLPPLLHGMGVTK